jgi:hypothetical protein
MQLRKVIAVTVSERQGQAINTEGGQSAGRQGLGGIKKEAWLGSRAMNSKRSQ